MKLSNRQAANLRKTFANHIPTDIKFSKTQLSKMIQLGEFLGRLLGHQKQMQEYIKNSQDLVIIQP